MAKTFANPLSKCQMLSLMQILCNLGKKINVKFKEGGIDREPDWDLNPTYVMISVGMALIAPDGHRYRGICKYMTKPFRIRFTFSNLGTFVLHCPDKCLELVSTRLKYLMDWYGSLLNSKDVPKIPDVLTQVTDQLSQRIPAYYMDNKGNKIVDAEVVAKYIPPTEVEKILLQSVLDFVYTALDGSRYQQKTVMALSNMYQIPIPHDAKENMKMHGYQGAPTPKSSGRSSSSGLKRDETHVKTEEPKTKCEYVEEYDPPAEPGWENAEAYDISTECDAENEGLEEYHGD